MDIAKSSLKLFTAKVGTTLITFLGITYFARLLGSHEMGVFFLFQAILGILAIPTDFGLKGAIEKRISENRDQGKFLTTAFIMKLIPFFAIIPFILIFQTQVNEYIGSEVAILLIIGLVLQEMAETTIKVLNAELRVGETAVIRLARKITWASTGVILIFLGITNALAIIIALIAGMIVMLTWGFYKMSVSFQRPSLRYGRSLFDFGKYSFIASVGGYIYNWMDVAILGLFVSQSLIGSYEIAWRVSLLGTILSQVIRRTAFPKMSALDSENKTRQIENIVEEFITPSMFLTIPMFFGVVLFSEEILGLVFGQEYTVAWLVLIILMLDSVQKSFYWVFEPTLRAIDRPDLDVRALLVGVFLNVILNFVLIWKFGIIGAAVATTIASSVVTILQIRYVSWFFKISVPYKEVGWCLFSAVLMSLVLFSLKNMGEINSVLKLVAIVVLGAVIYVLIALVYGDIRRKAMMYIVPNIRIMWK